MQAEKCDSCTAMAVVPVRIVISLVRSGPANFEPAEDLDDAELASINIAHEAIFSCKLSAEHDHRDKIRECFRICV